ncbi:MAG TPA: hypothetical protein VH518_10590 [Tepidisphaeraceae bacterium]|jgi:hypothetical protein
MTYNTNSANTGMSSGQWQRRLRSIMTAQPKKSAALAVLLAVLAAMAGRGILGEGRPTRASGSVSSVVRSGVDAGTVGGPETPSAAASGRSAVVLAALQKWSDAAVPPVSRNLFTVRIDYFPVDGSRTGQSDNPEDGFWARLEKSLALQADQKFKHDNLIANYAAQASDLKLQSIVMGSQPKAMVNGELVGEGSVVAGFRILRIEDRKMIVEREGIRLEIQMK